MDRYSYRFGTFRIGDDSRVLWRENERAPVPPKSADLLLALLEAGSEVVSREHLMKTVWPNTFVEDNNLAKHIFLLRKTLGSNEEGVPYIETVPRRGYRFVGHVERQAFRDLAVVSCDEYQREQIVIEEERAEPAQTRGTRVPWLVTCIVVLSVCAALVMFRPDRDAATRQWRSVLLQPFGVSGTDERMLGPAFTHELAARLRTIKALRVVSPTSPVNPSDIGERLGVETVLSGSLDFSNSGIRVTAKLASTKDGTVLWAEQATELDSKDISAAQARLASAVASRLRGRLRPGDHAGVERRGSASAEAYYAFLLGRAETLRIDVDNAPHRAVNHFESAVRLDPGFADAWAGLALAQQVQFFRGTAPRAFAEAALENAHRALAIDPNNIAARSALVHIYHSTGQAEDMLREAKRALEIDASDPDAQSAAGLAYFRTGMLDRAIELYERFVAAYPDDADAWYQLVHACLFARQYERGIRHAQPLLGVQRLAFPTFLLYANSGDLSRAVALARQIAVPGPAATYFAGQVLDRAGLHAEAQAAWTAAAAEAERRLATVDNDRTRMFLALKYARLNRPDAARLQISRALALNAGDPWVLFFASETYALLGDRSAAYDSLRRSVGSGFLGVHYLDYYQNEPNGWQRYRTDPEFLAIRSGLERKVAELRARY